jgi:hypothetical protein
MRSVGKSPEERDVERRRSGLSLNPDNHGFIRANFDVTAAIQLVGIVSYVFVKLDEVTLSQGIWLNSAKTCDQ